MTPSRLRIICLGDSLTLGIGSPELDKWPVRLALDLEKSHPGGYELYIRAWNGGTTSDALNKIQDEVGYLLPSIVLVTLGVNDALIGKNRLTAQVGLEDFRRNLQELHRYIIAKGGQTVLVVEHIPDRDNRSEDRRFYVAGNGQTYRENYQPYRKVILELGNEAQIPVIDLPALLEKEGTPSSAIVMEDGLHLSSDGNVAYARLVVARLREILLQLASARS